MFRCIGALPRQRLLSADAAMHMRVAASALHTRIRLSRMSTGTLPSDDTDPPGMACAVTQAMLHPADSSQTYHWGQLHDTRRDR